MIKKYFWEDTYKAVPIMKTAEYRPLVCSSKYPNEDALLESEPLFGSNLKIHNKQFICQYFQLVFALSDLLFHKMLNFRIDQFANNHLLEKLCSF